MCHYDYRRDMLLSQKEVYPYPEVEFVRSQLSFADRENPVACPGRLYGILRRRGIPMVIMVEEVRNAMMDAPPIGCTACRHFTNGCPLYIAIPDVFRAVNTMRLYHEQSRPRTFYHGLISQGHGHAADCVACSQCEGVCPRRPPIVKLLKEAAGLPDK